MPDNEMIRAVLFPSVKSIEPRPFARCWDVLKDILSHSHVNHSKTDAELWSPVVYHPHTTRGNRNIKYVTCLVVDMDGEAFDHARLAGLEYVAYTTWSHTADDQHWHLVLPLKYPVPGERWFEVWTRLHERINVVGDPQTKDPARIFYRPQHKPLTTPDIKIGCGEWLDPMLEERFVPGAAYRGVSFRNPRSYQSKTKRYWEDEAWWNEPQDLSRFEGLTQSEVAGRLLVEFRDLRKSWVLD